MRVTSMQPIEYLKVHLAYDGISTRLFKSLTSISKKIFDLTEQSAFIMVVMLIIGLFITAFMKLAEVDAYTSHCYEALCSMLQSMILVL